MHTFKTFLTEVNLSGGGKQAPYHKEKYIDPHIGKEHALELGKDHGEFKKGSKITVHSSHTDDKGKHHVLASVQGHKGKHHISYTHIKKPQIGRAGKSSLRAETEHLEHLKKQIHALKKQHGTSHIVVHTQHGPVKVSDVENVKGTPKADFALVDHHGHSVRYLSHKAGKTAKDFQQFGGISKHADHETVKSFANHLHKHYPHGISKATTVAMKLDKSNPKHKHLIHKMMYGDDYGKEHGINHVHEIHQGHMNLVPHENGKKGHYHLKSNNVHKSGHIPKDMHMMIYARTSHDRSDLGFKHTRIGVSPTTSRKVHHHVGDVK